LKIYNLFAWLISHQPAVLFSHNKPTTNIQPTVLFSQNKLAPAIGHQPNEQADKYVIWWMMTWRIVDGDMTHSG
jgi:hypothetical protein